MSQLSEVFNIGLLQNTLRTATPVILAAMGALFLTLSMGAVKKLCHQRKVKREAEKLAKEKSE